MPKLGFGHLDLLVSACQGWQGLAVTSTPPTTITFSYAGHAFGYCDDGNRISLELSPKIVYELKEDLFAQQHTLLSQSRWITFIVETPADIDHAVWLVKIAYLYHRVRIHQMGWGEGDLPAQLESLNLSPRLRRALTYTHNNWFST